MESGAGCAGWSMYPPSPVGIGIYPFGRPTQSNVHANAELLSKPDVSSFLIDCVRSCCLLIYEVYRTHSVTSSEALLVVAYLFSF